MNSRFLAPAENELAEALEHYSQVARDLGKRFLADVRRAVALIEQFPQASPVIEEGVRKKVMFEFPYSLFYRIAADEVIILAVAHQRRRPVNWRQRVSREGAG